MTSWADTPWVIVGAGRLGSLLGRMANEVGVPVRAAWSRQHAPAIGEHRFIEDLGELAPFLDGAIVWVTVVDDALEATVSELASMGEAALWLHGSGSLSSQVFARGEARGPHGSLHPLLSIADPEKAFERVGDVTWTIEGSDEARDFASWLLGGFGTTPMMIASESKTLYHASAVAASGLVTGAVDAALAIAEEAGLSRDEARKMLLPLVRSTVANLSQKSTDAALTGPVARSDAATIRAHIEALAALDDGDLLQIYRLLSRRMATATVRAETGLDD